MSLYNMILGENPHRATLMEILGLRRRDVGRFRDVYCKDDGTSIYVFTRNTHIDWCQPINEMLRQRPDFISSWKDQFDETFMTFEFKTPEEFVERVKYIADQTDNRPPTERFLAVIEDVRLGKDTAMTSRFKQISDQIAKNIKEVMNEPDEQQRKVSNESGGVDIFGVGGSD